ncbi:hypothetical protein OG21DRAFT_1602946 [Imleria badia]|nr:hypothetical protein OG21DRAFT_1602946 [Imleria badia]
MSNINDPHSASSVSESTLAIARTDEGILGTNSLSSDLHAGRNSLSRIFRLPIELLEPIFIYGARDYHSKDRGLPTPTVPSWVNVSYVCRHWRNVALNCATLWTYLFVISPRWTEELLSRSRRAPLKIHVNTDYGDEISAGLPFVDQVMNHVEHIQESHLHLPTKCRNHQVFSKLSLPAPRLQSLVIQAAYASSNLSWSSVLFDGDTPVLRTLELTYCPAPWYLFKLTGLTTLNLRHVPVRFWKRTEEFLATLRCMQDLTHLYLEDALASAVGFLSSPALHNFQKINLPRLSRLLIAAPLSTVITFLSCVNIPSRTKVGLECDSERGRPPDDYAALSSLLSQRFNMSDDQERSSPTIRSLIVNLCRAHELILTASERNIHLSASVQEEEWDCNNPLQTIVYFGPSSSRIDYEPLYDMDGIMRDICWSTPLANVQTIHIVEPPFSSAFWRKALGYLPNLRYLVLSLGRMPDLASVLSLTDDQGPDQVLVPALEELVLHMVELSLQESDAINPPSSEVQYFFDALSSRKGTRGRLTMNKCFATKILDMVGRWEGGHFVVESEQSR